MKKIDSNAFRKLINDTEVAIMGIPTKQSLNYMPYGSAIRDYLYGKAVELLGTGGYEKVLLSDLIEPTSLDEIDKISKISNGYMKLEDKNLMIAAGHEVNAYIYIKNLLKHHYDNVNLPLRIYNFGTVYRTNKNTKFPFNLGERKSFLECYSVFKTSEEAAKELEFATGWNRKIIKDILHIPSIEVVRPISTNKKISKKTICIDSITPLDETVITGMTYFHDDIFTKAIGVTYKDQVNNKNKLAYSTHFGLSENILFSYLLNSCDGEHLRLYSFLAPIQVSIINLTNDENSNNKIYELTNILKKENIRYRIEERVGKKINSTVLRNNRMGVPICLIIKSDQEGTKIYCQHDGNHKIIYNSSDPNINIPSILDVIKDLLLKNDLEITKDMLLKEKDSIIPCSKTDDLNYIIKSGKVAKIFLENTDERVRQAESYLTGGEVLGFDLKEEEGEDILTHSKVKSLAYVSRRS